MLNCEFFYRQFRKNGVRFFAGVPDSLLQDIGAYLEDHADAKSHIIAANEGGAVALAIGHYLATGRPGLVYMQNSGIGNAANPLLSLADPDVYGIPMVLLVGWRGEPGQADEPQHVKQGKVTLELFQTMGISCLILPETEKDASDTIARQIRCSVAKNQPVALAVRKGTFAPYRL
jgi:phosphonopyruvate decarboxylase